MNLKIIKKKIVLKYLKSNSRTRNVENGEGLHKITKVGILAESDLFQTYDFTRNLSSNFGLDKNSFNIILYRNSKINEELACNLIGNGFAEIINQKDFKKIIKKLRKK